MPRVMAFIRVGLVLAWIELLPVSASGTLVRLSVRVRLCGDGDSVSALVVVSSLLPALVVMTPLPLTMIRLLVTILTLRSRRESSNMALFRSVKVASRLCT